MEKQKAQALIICIWILVFLTVLSVTLGHTVSIALKTAKFQKNKLQASFLARAAVQLAVETLSDDKTPEKDTLSDAWAKKESFKNISISTMKEAKAEASVEDENRKVNINSCPKEVLRALLSHYKIQDHEALADNILAWRGEALETVAPEACVYSGLGYVCKQKPLAVPEELLLVKGIGQEDYQAIRQAITVYGSGKININTVSQALLQVLAEAAALALQNHEITDDDIERLAQKIYELRKNNILLSEDELTLENLREKLALGDVETDDATKLLETLVNWAILTGVSDAYNITATGTAGQASRVNVVVLKENAELKKLYWYEN